MNFNQDQAIEITPFNQVSLEVKEKQIDFRDLVLRVQYTPNSEAVYVELRNSN